jgi:predicted Rossmann fold nucleotide-binding protein DprA/Smf involved in DNA uptake
MRVLISGSRSIKDFDLSDIIPKNASLIICGGATGIDTIAEKYADEHGIQKLIIRPDYEKYGRAAPIIRNREMVELADLVIIVWDGISKGTKHTLSYAKKQGKEIVIKIIPANQ